MATAEDPNAMALVYNDPANMQLAGTSSQALTIPAPALRASSNPASGLKNVPAFLNKLYSMVNDPATDHLIRWTEDGTSFIVPSSEKFGKELLPRFFKHSNFGSFVRQLNMYGFHKVPHLQQGVLKLDDDDEKEKAEILEFQNDNFQRDQPDLLYLIQRKKGASTVTGARTGSEDPDGKASTPTTGPSSSTTPSGLTLSKLQADLGHILTEVQAIKRHQSILSTDLRDLQSTNRTLWQDNMDQRLKHDKNAEMIDKILKFLAGVFGGRALSEGASFMSGHNIAAADSSSGLGLGSYAQGRTNSSNGTVDQTTASNAQHNSTSNGFDFVPPHQRQQRLLLQGSPDKQTTIYDNANDDVLMSQFEELESDEDIPVSGKKSGRNGGGTASTDSPQSVDSGRFNEVKATSVETPPNGPQTQPTATTGAPSESLDVNSLINNDNIDWASINAILNNPNMNGTNGNNGGNASQQPFDYSNTDFSNFDFSNTGVFGMSNAPAPSTSSYPNVGTSAPTNGQYSLAPYTAPIAPLKTTPTPATEPPAFSLALSPANPSFSSSNNDNSQALTKYGDALTHVSDENAKIKERMDNLSSAIDRLVAHLPAGFTLPQQQQQQPTTMGSGTNSAQTSVSNTYDDEFDFSQYLNPSSVDLDSEELSGTSQPPFGSAQDPLAQYLDPSLAGFGGSSRDTSLGASGIPLSSTNPLASIPQNHQYASSAPQAVPASSLDVERGVKAEPSPTPSPAPSIAGDAGVTSTTSSGRKASKMPAKMPARSSKRRLSTSVSKPAEQASDSQRRSTRQKTGKT